MRPNARVAALAAVLLTVVLLGSGCIVVPVWWNDHYDRAPRVSVIHVHVYDYYTYAPISWAVVELYEQSWWDWDYVGSWHVNPGGYTAVQGGYLYEEGGPNDRDLGIKVYASGYYTEWFELSLDYWYPAETVSFYLVPWADCGDCWRPTEGQVPDLPKWDLPGDRVKVGDTKVESGSVGDVGDTDPDEPDSIQEQSE